MDKIWDRNPSKSEVIGLCGGDEKTTTRMTTQNRQMSNAKKNTKAPRQNLRLTHTSMASLKSKSKRNI